MQDPLRRPWTEPGRDPELAHAAERGDLAELFTLLREYRGELWRVCFALTLDRASLRQTQVIVDSAPTSRPPERTPCHRRGMPFTIPASLGYVQRRIACSIVNTRLQHQRCVETT